MKEMMIKLPVIDIAASDQTTLAKHYPKSGRYIIRFDNGDLSVADVRKRHIEDGEARSNDEKAEVYETFIGSQELLDPDDWVLALDAHAELEKVKCDMDDLKLQHEAELKAKELDCKKMLDAVHAEEQAIKDEFEARKAGLQQQMDTELKMRRQALEHEYETKTMQLELDTPKRFAQGEWVSAKTLKEIVETLVRGRDKEMSLAQEML